LYANHWICAMGVALLAPDANLFWDGEGLDRTDGVAHAQAVSIGAPRKRIVTTSVVGNDDLRLAAARKREATVEDMPQMKWA